jgi:hypothetical protein
MWYTSPSTSPHGRVSNNDMAADVQTDLHATEGVAVAEDPSEPENASPSATTPDTIRVRAAAAAGPGTEYWLP